MQLRYRDRMKLIEILDSEILTKLFFFFLIDNRKNTSIPLYTGSVNKVVYNHMNNQYVQEMVQRKTSCLLYTQPINKIKEITPVSLIYSPSYCSWIQDKLIYLKFNLVVLISFFSFSPFLFPFLFPLGAKDERKHENGSFFFLSPVFPFWMLLTC